MRTIVLTGGGTAGHVLPHFALLPHLRKHFDKIYYVGSHDGVEKKLVEKEGLEFHGITCDKLRRSLSPKSVMCNMVMPFKLLKGFGEAKRILRELKPDVVFSKGGFVAYPVVRSAAKLGITVIAHESDLSMGLANRMSVKYCQKICTTFAKTTESGNPQDKFIHTGSPIRAKIYQGKRGESNGKRNLLVMGGSLGAASINMAVREALVELEKKFNVVHICGRGKKNSVFDRASPLKKGEYIQVEYVDDIENYLAWADVVVSRAGSNALCELMVLAKAVLFIPLATGRGDQIENAQEVLAHDAGAVLYERDLTAETLLRGIEQVWARRAEFSKNTSRVVIDGTEAIAEIIKIT